MYVGFKNKTIFHWTLPEQLLVLLLVLLLLLLLLPWSNKWIFVGGGGLDGGCASGSVSLMARKVVDVPICSNLSPALCHCLHINCIYLR